VIINWLKNLFKKKTEHAEFNESLENKKIFGQDWVELDLIPTIIKNRNPTLMDKQEIGCRWVNRKENEVFIMTAINDDKAKWVEFDYLDHKEEE